MPPQQLLKIRSKRISSQQLFSPPPKPPKKPPQPQPFSPLFPQIANKIIIQMILLQPQPELLFEPHPQWLAVKSLILSLHNFDYALYYVTGHVNVSSNIEKIGEKF